jgi:hypothetical protein
MENENKNPIAEQITADIAASQEKKEQKGVIIGVAIAMLILLGGLIAFAVYLLTGNSETTEKIRDVFIIFMALESMVIGLVLIILVIQLARLTNLLQNEVKPILDSTNETVNTLRGTVRFLGDNLAEPVIKLNEYLAGLQTIKKIVLPVRKNNKEN